MKPMGNPTAMRGRGITGDSSVFSSFGVKQRLVRWIDEFGCGMYVRSPPARIAHGLSRAAG